jgi:uncharacterized repeat protein (TIGR01451 family)
VAIRVNVAALAGLGEVIQYHLCVENRSPAPAHHVVVHNPLPSNARFVRADPEPAAKEPELLWHLGTLPGGATRDIVLVVTPTGEGDVKSCARVQFEHGQCVCTKILRPAIELRKSGPEHAVVNELLNYQLVVTNTGTVAATGIRLTDVLPPELEHASGKRSLTWDLGSLAPGECREVSYQVTAKKTGRICNGAVATADGDLRREVEHCVTVGEASLVITNQGPKRRYVNYASAYQITVENKGTIPLEDVVITDTLPAQTSFVSASERGRVSAPSIKPDSVSAPSSEPDAVSAPSVEPEPATAPSPSTVRWSLGTLKPGEKKTVDLVFRANQLGTICHDAIATASRGQKARAEACTEFVGVSALWLDLSDTQDPIEVGGETSYVISVTNRGTIPATNIRLEALVPEELEVTRVQGPSDHKRDGARILFDAITLQSKGEARYVVHVKANASGDVRFKVDLKADQLYSGLPVHEEESTTIYKVNNITTSEPPPAAP